MFSWKQMENTRKTIAQQIAKLWNPIPTETFIAWLLHWRPRWLQKRGQKDCDTQRIWKYILSLCLLVTSEDTLMKSHQHGSLQMIVNRGTNRQSSSGGLNLMLKFGTSTLIDYSIPIGQLWNMYTLGKKTMGMFSLRKDLDKGKGRGEWWQSLKPKNT